MAEEEEILEEEFDFEEWLSQGIRAMKRAKKSPWQKRHKVYKKHMQAASKEVLMAFRSLVDEVIEQFEEEEEDKPRKEEAKAG